MKEFLLFLFGTFVGSGLGVFMLAMLVASRDEDDYK